LNGLVGVIVPQSCSTTDAVVGCVKVRLESGREVAVKNANLEPVPLSPGAIAVPMVPGGILPPPPAMPVMVPLGHPMMPAPTLPAGDTMPQAMMIHGGMGFVQTGCAAVGAHPPVATAHVVPTMPSQEQMLQQVLARMKSEGA